MFNYCGGSAYKTKENREMSDTATLTLPEVGTWAYDPTHSSIEITGRHMMVTKVRGRFEKYDIKVEVAEDITDSKVEVTIDAASINSGVAQRDQHLVSADFLDVENHPTITFVSTGLTGEGTDWKLTGDLTIRGVTRPVTLDVEFGGLGTDPFGNNKAFFSASATLERADWDLSWNVPLADGGVLVGKSLKLEVETQLVKA